MTSPVTVCFAVPMKNIPAEDRRQQNKQLRKFEQNTIVFRLRIIFEQIGLVNDSVVLHPNSHTIHSK